MQFSAISRIGYKYQNKMPNVRNIAENKNKLAKLLRNKMRKLQIEKVLAHLTNPCDQLPHQIGASHRKPCSPQRRPSCRPPCQPPSPPPCQPPCRIPRRPPSQYHQSWFESWFLIVSVMMMVLAVTVIVIVMVVVYGGHFCVGGGGDGGNLYVNWK